MIRAEMVVLLWPTIDEHLGMRGSGEPLRIEHLVAQRAVIALVAPLFSCGEPGT